MDGCEEVGVYRGVALHVWSLLTRRSMTRWVFSVLNGFCFAVAVGFGRGGWVRNGERDGERVWIGEKNGGRAGWEGRACGRKGFACG